MLPVHYRTADLNVRLFSTVATLGTPYDVTLEELRLETFFPADEASAAQALLSVDYAEGVLGGDRLDQLQ